MDFKRMQLFIINNLKGCSESVLIWYNTGLLPESCLLKDAANIFVEDNPKIEYIEALTFAEKFTIKRALYEVIR